MDRQARRPPDGRIGSEANEKHWQRSIGKWAHWQRSQVPRGHMRAHIQLDRCSPVYACRSTSCWKILPEKRPVRPHDYLPLRAAICVINDFIKGGRASTTRDNKAENTL